MQNLRCLFSAVALLVLASTSQAVLVSRSENASTAFFESGSESRIGLLCHNDPVNKTDPFGLAPVEIADDVDRAAQSAGIMVNALTQKDAAGFRLEAGKSIFRNGDGTVSISKETVRSDASQKIYAFPKPETSDQRTKAEVHSHVVESTDRKTGANTSGGDVKRGDVTGRPIYTNAPDGKGGVIQERYRPSDAKSVQDRQKEGGITERLRNDKWERIGK